MGKVTIISSDKLNAMTVTELRELCKKYGITGVSKARKDNILMEISSFYETIDPKVKSTSKGKTSEENKTYGTNERMPYVKASLNSVLQENNTYKTTISVSCGAASSNYPVVGKTVGFVKATYREILNIATDAKGIVNGKSVDDSYVLKSGDTLEFVREAGRKG